MAVNNLTVTNDLADAKDRIGDNPERMLGRGLNQPFNPSNSGARKLLSTAQADQTVPIKEPEVPIVGTGYEIRYGDLSSSIITAEGDYKVLRIIDKYSFKPRYHYWTIMYDKTNNIYKMIETKSFKHISEKHGYHYNTDFMDSVNEGESIPQGTILRKSTSYDEYNNRMDGANALCLYAGTERNTEDSIIVCEDVRRKYGTTHFRSTGFPINHNCRLLNKYGNDDEWKSFPDIGEMVKSGIFCSIREAHKGEELYTLSYNRLKESFPSDDDIIMPGRVVSIDVRSNDPAALNSFYNVQLKKYYDESIRVANEFVSAVGDILQNDPNAVLSDELKDMHYLQRRILRGDHFINEGKEPNNVYLEVTIEEDVLLEIGDKLADRYGGKGVVSLFLPAELMPKIDGVTVDMIINQATCVNRLNPGQLFEMELTNISNSIVKFIVDNKLSTQEAVDMILKFYSVASPVQYEYFKDYTAKLYSRDPDLLDFLIHSIIQDEYIYLSVRPILDNMTEDKLETLYDMFPFVDQKYLDITILDSNGNLRQVKSRRKAIASKKYMYRLKQFSEEKFSATSLSATNIKNLNAKSKSFKKYKSFHSNTPIAQGSMESDDLSSIGQEMVITNLMINSVSPIGRRLMKEALVGDPFALDIQLNDDASNRNVEILNAYQKTKGVALVFNKVRRKVKQLVRRTVPVAHPKQLARRVQDSPETIKAVADDIRKQNNREVQDLVMRNLVSDKKK